MLFTTKNNAQHVAIVIWMYLFVPTTVRAETREGTSSCYFSLEKRPFLLPIYFRKEEKKRKRPVFFGWELFFPFFFFFGNDLRLASDTTHKRPKAFQEAKAVFLKRPSYALEKWAVCPACGKRGREVSAQHITAFNNLSHGPSGVRNYAFHLLTVFMFVALLE
jgi:hypothetical protein